MTSLGASRTPTKSSSKPKSSITSSSSSSSPSIATPPRRPPQGVGFGSGAKKPVTEATSSPVRITTPIKAKARIIQPTSSHAIESKEAVITSPTKMSARYSPHKSANPFTDKKETKSKSPFALAYAAGRIPCRINHGSIHHRLQWDANPAEFDYSWLFPTVADGLTETEHPYVFVARTSFKELLIAEGASQKVIPLLPGLMLPLRKALTHADNSVFLAGMQAVSQLATCVGPAFTPHLSILLVQITKKSFKKEFQEPINNCLVTIAEHCGPDAVKLIKAKAPTFHPPTV